jgi:hypothetical protein
MALGRGHSSPRRGHVVGARSLLNSAGPPRRIGAVSADERDPPRGENISPAPTFLKAIRPMLDTRSASCAVGAYRSHSSPIPRRAKLYPCFHPRSSPNLPHSHPLFRASSTKAKFQFGKLFFTLARYVILRGMRTASDFWDFLQALWADWVALTSGIISVAIWAASAIFPKELPSWLFWPAGLLAFLVAAFRVWRKEHCIVIELQTSRFSPERVRQAEARFSTLTNAEKKSSVNSALTAE